MMSMARPARAAQSRRMVVTTVSCRLAMERSKMSLVRAPVLLISHSRVLEKDALMPWAARP